MAENLKDAKTMQDVGADTETDVLAVYIYHSPDCENSTKIAPKIEELATRYPDVVFLRVDMKEFEGQLPVYVLPAIHFWEKSSHLTQYTMEGEIDVDQLEKNIQERLRFSGWKKTHVEGE